MDVGGASASDVEDEIDDALIGEISSFLMYDHRRAIDLALQQDILGSSIQDTPQRIRQTINCFGESIRRDAQAKIVKE